MSERVVPSRLEGWDPEQIWEDYAASQLPPIEVTGEFARSQIRKGFLSGFWTALKMEERTRREDPARSRALMDQWRTQAESLCLLIDADERTRGAH